MHKLIMAMSSYAKVATLYMGTLLIVNFSVSMF